MNNKLYIGVGSNIDPERSIFKALTLLRVDLRVTAISTCFQTSAIGHPEQNDYINCVWQAETTLAPLELKHRVLNRIETELGRVRGVDRYAARTIDLDILLYADLVFNQSGLVIPDPDITRRNFIAVALLELDPTLILPGTAAPLASHAAAQDMTGLKTLDDFTTRLRERLNYEY